MKIKLQLLLVSMLLGNAVLLQGMTIAQSGFVKASRSGQRERSAFATRLAESFWQRIWPSVVQWWKSLSEPKTHAMRAARWQKQTAEEAKKVAEEQQGLLEEEKKVEQEEKVEKVEKEVGQEEVK